MHVTTSTNHVQNSSSNAFASRS